MATQDVTPAPPSLPCKHARPRRGCAFCWLAASDPRYAALFGRRAAQDGVLPPRPSPADVAGRPLDGLPPCASQGPATGQTVECPSCTGKVRLKLFACTTHGVCTVGPRAVPGVACCRTCPDYLLPPPVTADVRPRRFPVRDCLYHVFPLAKGGRAWRRGLSMLCRRSALFTGRKVVSCMTGAEGLESPFEVRRIAEPAGFEVRELSNDPTLRETRTLLELLPSFATDDPERALFVGHAKGVTRPDNPGETAHPWSVLCHELCLDYWPLVESRLRLHPVTGPFRKVGRGFQGSRSAWHYSGGFYWLRGREFFARDRGNQTDRRWYGSESSVGVWYGPGEAGCLFGGGTQEDLDLYRPEVLQPLLSRYALWRAENEGMRTTATTEAR